MEQIQTTDLGKLSDNLVVVDFWADWCGPCKVLTPRLEEIASEFSGAIRFVGLDVSQATALCQEMGILSVPTLVLYHQGQAVEKVTGVYPKAKLLAYFQKKVEQYKKA